MLRVWKLQNGNQKITITWMNPQQNNSYSRVRANHMLQNYTHFLQSQQDKVQKGTDLRTWGRLWGGFNNGKLSVMQHHGCWSSFWVAFHVCGRMRRRGQSGWMTTTHPFPLVNKKRKFFLPKAAQTDALQTWGAARLSSSEQPAVKRKEELSDIWVVNRTEAILKAVINTRQWL